MSIQCVEQKGGSDERSESVRRGEQMYLGMEQKDLTCARYCGKAGLAGVDRQACGHVSSSSSPLLIAHLSTQSFISHETKR
jgi:hypothetical protein